ncbi:hypothetical protein EG329_007738 [Mollisiaceae sp. DMI_Dod_QoI]|nr:hypothetical protein EG329_007738 [Helotiales sp. DMI_Dod_QoI]
MQPIVCLFASLALAAKLAVGQPLSCAAGLDGKLPSIIPSDFHFSGKVRTYYIQAEQDTWDYAASGWDNWLGVPFNDSPRAASAGYTATGSFGTKWQKALYRGYTDASFTQRTQQPSWQGINGPTLRAEVGDMIQILFINNLTSNYVSMHSMGLAYSKEFEGSIYPNTTTGGAPTPAPGDAVAPGDCVVYKWLINDGSAPYPGTDSTLWSYHSFVNMAADLNTGLQGPTIVYNSGMMNSTMASHREFILLYENFDETQSFLASTNQIMYGNATNASSNAIPVTLEHNYSGNTSFWKPQLTNMPTVTLSSTQAPQWYTLNGAVFSNLPPFEMCTDDRAIWYVYSFGAASHVFHMHGNGFNYHGNNMASKSINDGNMMTLQMNATATGIWQVLCHVNDHLSAGMEGNYQVYPKAGCPLPALSSN